MSFDTNDTFIYQIVGRDVHLYQYIYSARTDILAGYRIRIPDSFFGDQLVYPDETIVSGLRFEGTTLTKSFVTESLESTTAYVSSIAINFQVAASVFHTADDVVFAVEGKTLSGITDADKYFYVGQSLAITGSINNNGTKTVATVSSTSLTINETVTEEGVGAIKTVDDLTPTPDGAWEASLTHTDMNPTSTSGSGLRMQVTAVTDVSGEPTFTITSGGAGYIVGDKIIFTDPGSTSNTTKLIVATLRGDISIANNSNAILGGVAGTDTFTDFAAADKIRVQGSTSNDADYEISSISSNGDALVVSSAPSSLETEGAKISIKQIPLEVASPSEASHVNLNRMLSLAVIDYIKGQVADLAGNVQLKEYYMREFWKKVGDDKSNKIKTGVSYTSNTYAVK